MCSGTDRASITIEYNSNSKLRRKSETKSKSKKKTAKNMCKWISCRLGIKTAVKAKCKRMDKGFWSPGTKNIPEIKSIAAWTVMGTGFPGR